MSDVVAVLFARADSFYKTLDECELTRPLPVSSGQPGGWPVFTTKEPDMTHPIVTESKQIGTFAGQPMHAWTEVYPDGTVRTFEDYATSFFAPTIGRTIGLTMVRETTAA